MSANEACSMCGQKAVARSLCAAHYARASARGEREEHPRRPRQEGKVCPAGHKHAATTSCYKTHGCRCAACRDAIAKRSVASRKMRAYGTAPTLVDATIVQAWLLELARAGIRPTQLARLTGISKGTIDKLARPNQPGGRMVRNSTAAAILAVEFDERYRSPRAQVDARGARRRLQALVVQGWSFNKLAHAVHTTNRQIRDTIVAPTVTADLHERIAQVFDQLWNVSPPAAEPHDRSAMRRAVAHGRAHRWQPALAWDDIDTDEAPADIDTDPTTDGVDAIAVELAVRGEPVRLTAAERRLALTHLVVTTKLDDRHVAERLHIDRDSVGRIRRELGLPSTANRTAA